jgi:predicted nucleic acid-binding protein
VALLDCAERHHRRCVAALAELDRPLVTCEAVIAESCYLLRRLQGASERVLENVENGNFQIPLQLANSAPQIRALMRKYRNIPASLADACLIAMAEEFQTGDILTLDSDFLAYRWQKNRPFQPLIPLQA